MSNDTQLDLLPEDVPEGEYLHLDVTCLDLGMGQAPDKALVESMHRFGLLQPIIVTPKGTMTWQVIDGRRRVLSARLLGWEVISGLVLPRGSVNPHVVQLASHRLRSRNKAAEVDAIETLYHDGATETDIAEATGLTKQEIRALLPLTNLSPTLRGALRDGKVTATVALEMAKLPLAAQQRLEDTYIEKGKVTAPDVKEQRLARTQAAARALDLDGLADDVPDVEDVAEHPFVQATKLALSDAVARAAPVSAPLAQAMAAITYPPTILDDHSATDAALIAATDKLTALGPLIEALDKAHQWGDLKAAKKALVDQWRAWGGPTDA